MKLLRVKANTKISRSFKFMFAILGLASIFLFTSCGININTISKNEIIIYAFIEPADTEYWCEIREGMEAASRGSDVLFNIVELDLKGDFENSLKAIKKVNTRTTDAIIIKPFANEELETLLQKIYEKGIEIIYFDSTNEYDIPGTYIYSDIQSASNKAGEILTEVLGGKGEVVLLNVQSDVPMAKDVEHGFNEAIKKYPELKLINTFDCSSSRTITNRTLNDILAAHPDINGIFAASPEIAVGAISALNNSGKTTETKVVAYGYNNEIASYVDKGIISGVVSTNPYDLGYTAATTAINISKGEEIPEKIDVGYDVLTTK